ncbi:MAG: hypothetical protein WDN31_04305 [Hyphomicrobium sp.]
MHGPPQGAERRQLRCGDRICKGKQARAIGRGRRLAVRKHVQPRFDIGLDPRQQNERTAKRIVLLRRAPED